MENTELTITKQDAELALVPKAVTPMEMLQVAVNRGADLAMIQQLMDLQDRFEKTQARKAFDNAFADFKAESVKIIKNITVTDGPLKGKKYADLFAVVNAITPALSKHGLSSSWKLTKDDPAWMEVTCILRHRDGHSESVSMGGAPDTGGAKSAIQARASTKSYLERYTFLAVTGMTAAGEDHDGNTPSTEGMDEETYIRHMDFIENASSKDELKRYYLAAITEAQKTKDKNAEKNFINATNRRKKELE